jgi:tetratricopeptide (TPR) repeat protein
LQVADCLYHLNHLADAVNAYREALQELPDDAQVWLAQAFCLLKQGNIPETLACLTQAVALEPRLYETAIAGHPALQKLRGHPQFLALAMGV